MKISSIVHIKTDDITQKLHEALTLKVSISSKMNVSFFTMAEGKLFKGFPCTEDAWLSEITVSECQFAA